MTRTVIRMEEWGDGEGGVRVNFRPDEPNDVKDRMRWRTLSCASGQAPFTDLAAIAPGEKQALAGDLVRTVGTAIHAALSQHPGVAEALDRAAQSAPGERHPIHLLTSALDAEVFPWEAMHHPKGRFLGLDPRFAIARAIATGGGALERTHDAPLRMTAILAAADRDAHGEWHALRDAITAGGLEVHLTLFVAHDDLEASALAGKHSWVNVHRVPPTKEELIATLRQSRPNLLHVYSHGTAQGGGFIEIATPGSVAGFTDQLLYLEARHLAELQGDVWLITLDACEGATPSDGVHSLAYTLVECGVPAAIGMREAIDSADANTFCRAFYAQAFGALAQQLLPGTRVTLDWAPYVAAAREALCARLPGPSSVTASKQKPWTLPVLYRRAEELVIFTPSTTPTLDADERARLLGELEVFRRALSELHPDNPPVVRAQLEQAIAARETRLRDA
jgi:hypothetical protein